MATPLVGIREAEVSAWMTTNVGTTAPLRFELVAGGRSNLTYKVLDGAGRAYALRRPPVSHLLPTAHDMAREHRIISTLYPAGVPLPRPLGLCFDVDVNDQPFYVMEFVEGIILRDRNTAETYFSTEERGAISRALTTNLAALHDVDVDQVGLGQLARHDQYLERQLRRWTEQFRQSSELDSEATRLTESLSRSFAATIPRQQRTSVVHGDFRLDNVVLRSDTSVQAILDWEICTLGDPIADLGVLLMYWTEASDDAGALSEFAPTTAEGFITRDEVLASYALHSTLDLSEIAYYQAFGFWKLACILQGVYSRYQGGASAGDESSVSDFPDRILRLSQTAQALFEGRKR